MQQRGVSSCIFNSQVSLPYANSGVGTKAVRINPGTGLLTYADTLTSASLALTSTYIPVGNSSNVFAYSAKSFIRRYFKR